MSIQIKQKKGYPDSTGKMHALHIDALKSQSLININKAVDERQGSTSVQQFISENVEVVKDYIKYQVDMKVSANKKAKPKARPKTKTVPA